MRILPDSPIECVAKLPDRAKHPRRPLEMPEISRFLAAALEGPLRRAKRSLEGRPRKDGTIKPVYISPRRMNNLKVAGQRIYLMYVILLGTGLRVNELRNLKWRDVDLENGVLQFSKEWTKNRKADILPLAPQVLCILNNLRRMGVPPPSRNTRCKSLATGTGPDLNVIGVSSRVLRCFDDDLAAAGIEKVNAQGQVVCLHSLRHTFGHLLNYAGVDPKTLQTLMRNSTPVLTLNIYVHRSKERERQAIASLPPLAPQQEDAFSSHPIEPSGKFS